MYLMYQAQLGEQSFWAPYIDLMPSVKWFCEWDKKDIMLTMDPYLVRGAIIAREILQNTWQDVLSSLKDFPNLFSKSMLKKEIFLKYYAQVCSRCFGWGMPHTSLIPMADSFNHSDQNFYCAQITKSLHM